MKVYNYLKYFNPTDRDKVFAIDRNTWNLIRIQIIIIIITIYSLEFFASALADGPSQEFEWQQLSSSLPDSSHYSGRYQ